MALLPGVFIPEEADDMEFTTLPAAWYPALIVKSDVVSTKKKDGKYISLKFKIDDNIDIKGEEIKSEGRFLFPNLNIVNKSEMAVKIGRSDLKAITKAVGLAEDYELEDTVDLHDELMMIKVVIKPATSEWPEKNEVKGYLSMDEYEEKFGDYKDQ